MGNFSDDFSLILNYDKQISYKLFPGDDKNFKITSAFDLEIASKI